MTSTWYSDRACPCCGDDSIGRRKIKSDVSPSQLNWNQVRNSWNERILRVKVFFDYSRCINCGLLYCAKYFKQSALNELYASMVENMCDVSESDREATQVGYTSYIKSNAIPCGDYLEIGPDVGLFARRIARDEFPQIGVFHLVEPNVSITSTLKDNLEGRVTNIYHELDSIRNLRNNSIALAVGIHVFDHLINPKELLVELHEKLVKGGSVVIITHNERSLMARCLRARWPAYCLQHPQLFNFKTTTLMLRDIGYDISYQSRTYNVFRLNFLFNKLMEALKINFNISVGNVPLKIRLGNMVTIARKK